MTTRSFGRSLLGSCLLVLAASAAAGDRTSDRPASQGGSASRQAAPAAGAGAAGAGAAAPAAPRQDASGVVEGRVEMDRANRLTVAGSEDEGLAFEQFRIDDRTEVTIDGQRASAAQVNAGDEVRASYSGAPDALHVDRLEVVTGEGASEGQQRRQR